MIWCYWVGLGLALILLEIVVPKIVFLLFGLSLLETGIITILGIDELLYQIIFLAIFLLINFTLLKRLILNFTINKEN